MLRIIGGRLGGRRIAAPKGEATRPTAEKVRGALFNMLDNLMALEGAVVLDLYAGSGALGLEALSRGAARVTFVEANARTAAVIRGNIASLEIASAAAPVVVSRVLPYLGRAPSGPPANLILADPPYAAGEYEPLLAKLAAWPGAAEGARIAVEAPGRLELDPPRGLELTRVKRYGDTQLWMFRTAERNPPVSTQPLADPEP